MFSKKRRTCWTAAPDLERREPVLPHPVADPEDLLMSEQQTPSAEARAGVLNPTPSPLGLSESAVSANPTAHAALKRQEPPCASENSANGLASRSPYVSRTEVSFPEDLDLIGQGIASLLAEEKSELSPARTKADGAVTPRALLQDSAAELLLSEAAFGTDGRADHVANAGGVALPGLSSHSELHKRLMTQLSEAMWFPKGTGDKAREDRLIEAFDALVGIYPQDEIEGMLACQIIVTHRAALDCLQLSMAPATTCDERRKIIEQVEQLLLSFTRNLSAMDQYRNVARTGATSCTSEEGQFERPAGRLQQHGVGHNAMPENS